MATSEASSDGASFLTAVRSALTSLRAEVDVLNTAKQQDGQRISALEGMLQRQGLEQERMLGNVNSLGFMMAEHDKIHLNRVDPYLAKIDTLVEQLAILKNQCDEDAKILNERFPALEAQGTRLNELINSLNRQVPMAFDKVVKKIDYVGSEYTAVALELESIKEMVASSPPGLSSVPGAQTELIRLGLKISEVENAHIMMQSGVEDLNRRITQLGSSGVTVTGTAHGDSKPSLSRVKEARPKELFDGTKARYPNFRNAFIKWACCEFPEVKSHLDWAHL